MTRSAAVYLATAALLGAVLTAGVHAAQGAVSDQDRKFITEAAQGGMAEVKLGEIAGKQAASADVKNFGQRMVDDHSRLNQELKKLATDKGVPLPDSIGPKHQATVDRLSKLSGEAFDRAYMGEMVKDHTHDVAAFEQQSTRAEDPDLKAWSGKSLPTLRQHLQMAREIAEKVGAPKE